MNCNIQVTRTKKTFCKKILGKEAKLSCRRLNFFEVIQHSSEEGGKASKAPPVSIGVKQGQGLKASAAHL